MNLKIGESYVCLFVCVCARNYRDQEKGTRASGSKRLFTYYRVDKNKTAASGVGTTVGRKKSTEIKSNRIFLDQQ
jgi:hypothetical protein